jgi:hypothetical protein
VRYQKEETEDELAISSKYNQTGDFGGCDNGIEKINVSEPSGS